MFHRSRTPTKAEYFYLPRFEESFSKLPDNGGNPHYTSVFPVAKAWRGKFTKDLCGPNMIAFLERANFELLASYAYPYAEPKGLKAAMDVVTFFFLLDEYTDTQTEEGCKQAAINVEKAFKDLEFNDGSFACKLTRDFQHQHFDGLYPNVERRFIENTCNTMVYFGNEARLRAQSGVLNFTDYLAFRLETSATLPAFDLCEYGLGIDLPQYVHDDVVFGLGRNAAAMFVALANDIFSYNMEQAKGHAGANALTVVIRSKGYDIQSAINFVAGYCEALLAQLLNARANLAAREEPIYSRDAVKVLDAYGDWVRGNDRWSYATERYFGKDNESVKRTRLVKIRKPFEESLMDLKD